MSSSFNVSVARAGNPTWHGDYAFAFRSLILKDFRVRYRNMSLGMFWSLLNPLVMMGVLWFVFTKIFRNSTPNFALFLLCGIVPFNLFAQAVAIGTTSLVDNAGLIKRVLLPRSLTPIATVFAVGVHLLIQVALLLVLAAARPGVNVYWLYLPLVWGCELAFITGLVLMVSALNVYIRDMRYVVESVNTVLFWLVPIMYPFSLIPSEYRDLYQYNPVAALVLATRNVLWESIPPPETLLIKLAVVSIVTLGAGFVVFRALSGRFYDYL